MEMHCGECSIQSSIRIIPASASTIVTANMVEIVLMHINYLMSWRDLLGFQFEQL